MKTAKPVDNVLDIEIEEFSGEIYCLKTRCTSTVHYLELPVAVQYQGVTYGKTGWDSDACRAYYKSDVNAVTLANAIW